MLYEDDFEFEEQPANIRDRAVPGSGSPDRGGFRRRNGGGGYGGGDNRRRGPRQYAPHERSNHPLPDDAKPARDLLSDLLQKMGVGPIEIDYIPRQEGEYLEVSGPELGMLIGRHGNTLEALNLLFNNMLNVGVRSNRRYFTIDAEGYRARRAEQLRELALATLERCVRDGKPQRLEPMLPSERKIVHIALADSPSVRTESEGEEPERRVVIFPA
jgi:spoIIIJ-associated protein